MRIPLVAVLLTVLGTAGTALSEDRPSKPNLDELRAKGPGVLLEAVDKYHNDYSTQKWKFRMTLKAKTGSTRQMVFKTWQKGQKRLIRFLEPGEVKGMSVLIRPGGTMYVYSPQTDNVRRVATHARRQTFMGSDFTMDDMGQIDFNIDYDPKFGKEDADHVWMDLTLKEGREIQWKKLRLRLSKKDAMINLIEYFDGDRKVKTQERSNHGEMGGVSTYQKIVMTDQASGHQTIVEMLEQTVGDDIPNQVFSKRSLVRGD